MFLFHPEGPFGSSRVQYVVDHTMKIVFLSAEPSIVMTYDSVQSLHSVWALRRVRAEVRTPGREAQKPSCGAVGLEMDWELGKKKDCACHNLNLP